MTNPFVQLILAALLASSSALAIIGGEDVSPDSDLAKKAVMVMSQLSDQSPDGIVVDLNCSGSLIAKNIVLTSAHCFHAKNVKFKDPHPKLQTAVLFGNDPIKDILNDRAQALKAKKVILHPEYVQGIAEHDIAIIVLEKNAPEGFQSFGLNFSEEYNPRLSYTYVGYSANSKNEEFIEQHKLRSLKPQMRTTNFFDGSPLDSQYYVFMADEQTGHETVEGDSGGPLLVSENGKTSIVGILSQHFEPKNEFDQVIIKMAWYTKLSPNKKWLQTTIQDILGSR